MVIIVVQAFIISEHNHELFCNISLCSAVKPETHGVLCVCCVSILTLRFFIGSGQALSDTGEIIKMSFSSSANLSCFPVCCGELYFNFLFDTGVFLLEIGFTGVVGVTFTGVCGIDGLSC